MGHQPVVPGAGPLDARLLILGERPGETEMREGAPMVGATGMHVYRALDSGSAAFNAFKAALPGALREAQVPILERLSLRIDNVRCSAEDEFEHRVCAEHQRDALATLSGARVLLCVGADATRAIFGRDDMSALHGSVWTRAEIEAMRDVEHDAERRLPLPPGVHTVICSYHPAHAMRGFPQAMTLIYRAIQKARLWSLRESGPERRWQVEVSPTPEFAKECLWAEPGIWGLDIETPRDNHTWIKMISIAYAPNQVVVLPGYDPFMTLLRERLKTQPYPTIIGHNLAFDERGMLANDLPILGRRYDTIQREALLRPVFKDSAKRKWLALSTCLQHRLDDWPYHKEPNDPHTQAAYRVMLPDVPEGRFEEAYCGLDGLGARRLFEAQKPELQREGMEDLYENIVAPAAPVCVRMEERGALMDEPLRIRRRKEADERLIVLREEIGRLAADFHAARRARLEKQIESALALVDHEKTTYPLFPGSGSVKLERCRAHPEYRGLTRRMKCEDCALIYPAAEPLRKRVKDLLHSATQWRMLLKRIGLTFDTENDNHWREWLFNKDIGLGLTPVAFTDKMNLPKVDDESIEQLARLNPDKPVLALRTEVQRLLHLKRVILSVPTDEAGFAHFAFSLHRSVTGRSSSGTDDDDADKYRASDGGNAQNWKDEDRRMIIAGPGKRWASADFSQIDARCVAWRSGDRKMIAAFRDGLDIHARNAARCFGVPETETRERKIWLKGKWQSARQGGKLITHPVNYGAREEKIGNEFRPWQGKPFDEVLAFVRRPENRSVIFRALRLRRFSNVLNAIDRIAGKPEHWHRIYAAANTATAKGWIDAYFAEWPRQKEYQEELIARASRDGFITNAWGRKMWIHEWKYETGSARRPADINDVIAFPGQGDAGEIAKGVLPGIEQVFGICGGALRLFVHDSFDGDIHPDAESEFVMRGRIVLSREWPEMGEIEGFGLFSVPADFAFGDNWGKHPGDCKNTDPAACTCKNPGGLREWRQSNARIEPHSAISNA